MAERSDRARAELAGRRAIKAMHDAYEALAAITPEGARSDHSIFRLRRDLAEYADYLEGATWWRSGDG